MHRPALMRLALGVGLSTILMLAGPGLVHDGEVQALYTPGVSWPYRGTALTSGTCPLG